MPVPLPVPHAGTVETVVPLKKQVPAIGSVSFPTEIAGGQWKVSVKKESDTQYLFTVSPSSNTENRAYVYAYVNAWGEESGPSQPLLTEVVPGIGLQLQLIAPPANHGYVDITKFRLYRTNTGSQSTDYQFVADYDISAAAGTWQNVNDNIANGELGEVMSTLGWAPPPAGIKGLKMMGNGIAVAFKGQELWFSEPYLPSVMKQGNTLTFPNAIVGLQPYEQNCFVTTTANPWLVNGVAPDAMTQMQLPEIQAGVNKNAITQLGNTVIYLSHDGLVLARGLDTSITQSQQLFTRRTWRERYAQNLPFARLTAHDGMVLVSFDNGAMGFILRLDEAPGLTRYDQPAHATTIWPENDWMYVTNGTAINAFGGSPNTLPWIWHSQDFILPKPSNFGCFQASGTGEVSFTFYVDGAFKHSATVQLTSLTQTFRLPSGFVGTRWSVEINGEINSSVTRLHIATSPLELQGVS
jgi:hypothetical protein